MSPGHDYHGKWHFVNGWLSAPIPPLGPLWQEDDASEEPGQESQVVEASQVPDQDPAVAEDMSRPEKLEAWAVINIL